MAELRGTRFVKNVCLLGEATQFEVASFSLFLSDPDVLDTS